jgi:HK97 family phage major capsid protein
MRDSIIGRVERRAATVERAGVDRDNRTVSLAFSSEAPVERVWGTEILDHSPKSVRLGRLTDGGPVLLDHDPTKHIGVVEQVRIGKDRVGRAVVRFGRGPEAEAAFRDVIDGIRRHVSVGYRIHDAVEEVDNGQKRHRVMDWEPHELSLVAIPADASVGVGRSVPDLTHRTIPMPIDTNSTSTPTDAAQIRAIGEQYRQHISEADELRHILAGSTVEEFRRDIMQRMETAPTPIGAPAIGGSSRAPIERFSIAKFIRQSANDTLDGVERELSREAARNSAGLGMHNPLPIAALATRGLTVGVGTTAGNLVATDLRGDLFADLLRNRSMCVALGARVLPGLSGNVDIPRQTAGATAQWLTEVGTATASDPSIGKLSLSPKRVSAYVVYSKQLLLQSSIAIEDMLRRDLLAQIGVAVDAAMINGLGTSNQPRGVLNTTALAGTSTLGANGGAPTWDTLVEMERLVADQNADDGALGYLTNSKVRSKLKRSQRGTNLDYVWAPGDSPANTMFASLNGYRAAVSNNVPSTLTKGTSTTVCSALIFGNWFEAMLAQFGDGIDIVVDPYSKAETAEIRIVATSFLDVGVRQPGAFSVCLDALTT